MMRGLRGSTSPRSRGAIADRDLPPRAVLTLLSLSLDRSAAADAALYPIGWRSRDLSMIDGIWHPQPERAMALALLDGDVGAFDDLAAAARAFV